MKKQHESSACLCVCVCVYQVLIPRQTGSQVDEQRLSRSLSQLDDTLDKLETMFLGRQPFLCGHDITLADLLAVCELMQVSRSILHPLQTPLSEHCPLIGSPSHSLWVVAGTSCSIVLSCSAGRAECRQRLASRLIEPTPSCTTSETATKLNYDIITVGPVLIADVELCLRSSLLSCSQPISCLHLLTPSSLFTRPLMLRFLITGFWLQWSFSFPLSHLTCCEGFLPASDCARHFEMPLVCVSAPQIKGI